MVRSQLRPSYLVPDGDPDKEIRAQTTRVDDRRMKAFTFILRSSISGSLGASVLRLFCVYRAKASDTPPTPTRASISSAAFYFRRMKMGRDTLLVSEADCSGGGKTIQL